MCAAYATGAPGLASCKGAQPAEPRQGERDMHSSSEEMSVYARDGPVRFVRRRGQCYILTNICSSCPQLPFPTSLPPLPCATPESHSKKAWYAVRGSLGEE